MFADLSEFMKSLSVYEVKWRNGIMTHIPAFSATEALRKAYIYSDGVEIASLREVEGEADVHH